MNDQIKSIKNETKQQAAGYITAAFGLVAGLAWNEAIKSLIEYLFPLSQGSLLAKFIYAILMTIVVAIVASYIMKMLDKEKNSN